MEVGYHVILTARNEAEVSRGSSRGVALRACVVPMPAATQAMHRSTNPIHSCTYMHEHTHTYPFRARPAPTHSRSEGRGQGVGAARSSSPWT